MPGVFAPLADARKDPEPPGYRQRQPRERPKLAPFLPLIHEILEQDQTAPRKQRHTIRRIFDRLRTEHGYTGGITVVGDVMREWRATTAEVFLPLSQKPGEAQFDFGAGEVVLQGVPTKIAYCVMSLPYSDAFFVQVFPRECTETFQAGHRRAFEFFGGVPHRISIDYVPRHIIDVELNRYRGTRSGCCSPWSVHIVPIQ